MIAKKMTGTHATAYSGKASLSLSLRRKKWAAQKQTNIAPKDSKREVNPSNSFLGKSLRKSFCWHLEVRITKNVITEVTEKARAIRDETPKIINPGCCSRLGLPLFSIIPPGTLAVVAKATVVISVVTNEHELAVLFSHCPPFSTRCLCDSLNTSFGVIPLLFGLLQSDNKSCGTVVFTYCGKFNSTYEINQYKLTEPQDKDYVYMLAKFFLFLHLFTLHYIVIV